jgi:hypothetical protein
MLRVPVAWSMLPATMNSGALYRAWANRKATTASAAPGLGRPISSVSVPSAETVLRARMRLRSRSRSASTAAQTAVSVPVPTSITSQNSRSLNAGSSRAIR